MPTDNNVYLSGKVVRVPTRMAELLETEEPYSALLMHEAVWDPTFSIHLVKVSGFINNQAALFHASQKCALCYAKEWGEVVVREVRQVRM